MVLNLTKKDTAEEITFKNYRKCKITLTRLVTCRFVQSTLLYKEQRNFCYDNCFRLSGISVILLILNLVLFELINYWLIVLFSLINNLYESGAHQTTCIIQPILQPAFENLHTYIFYFVMQVSSTVKTFTADMDLPRTWNTYQFLRKIDNTGETLTFGKPKRVMPCYKFCWFCKHSVKNVWITWKSTSGEVSMLGSTSAPLEVTRTLCSWLYELNKVPGFPVHFPLSRGRRLAI